MNRSLCDIRKKKEQFAVTNRIKCNEKGRRNRHSDDRMMTHDALVCHRDATQTIDTNKIYAEKIAHTISIGADSMFPATRYFISPFASFHRLSVVCRRIAVFVCFNEVSPAARLCSVRMFLPQSKPVMIKSGMQSPNDHQNPQHEF